MEPIPRVSTSVSCRRVSIERIHDRCKSTRENVSTESREERDRKAEKARLRVRWTSDEAKLRAETKLAQTSDSVWTLLIVNLVRQASVIAYACSEMLCHSQCTYLYRCIYIHARPNADWHFSDLILLLLLLLLLSTGKQYLAKL